jgi:hypothetical protein
MSSFGRGLVIIVIVDIRDPDHEDPHAAMGAVDNAGRNMNEGPLRDLMFDAIELHRSSTIEDVVKLGRLLVVVGFGAVNIDRMSPGGGVGLFVLTTDEPVAPSAGTFFTWGLSLMAHEGG